jgi:hypothetical protein
MKPANLDELEDKVLKAMHRLGSYLMEGKMNLEYPIAPGEAGYM